MQHLTNLIFLLKAIQYQSLQHEYTKHHEQMDAVEFSPCFVRLSKSLCSSSSTGLGHTLLYHAHLLFLFSLRIMKARHSKAFKGGSASRGGTGQASPGVRSRQAVRWLAALHSNPTCFTLLLTIPDFSHSLVGSDRHQASGRWPGGRLTMDLPARHNLFVYLNPPSIIRSFADIWTGWTFQLSFEFSPHHPTRLLVGFHVCVCPHLLYL